jgi:bis(5'-nucleosyl)-tetraphosphatase (symmetrical)
VLGAPDRDELLAWLISRPLMVSDPALGWTMLHAGLPPQWDLETAAACAREVEQALARDPAGLFAHMYGDEPSLWSPDLTGWSRLRYIINSITRLRFVSEDGRILVRLKGPPGDGPPGSMPWFRHPGRRSRGARILCGHWSALGYVDEDGVRALDTGCVWGGSLCAVRLDADEPPRFLPCKGSLRIGDD